MANLRSMDLPENTGTKPTTETDRAVNPAIRITVSILIVVFTGVLLFLAVFFLMPPAKEFYIHKKKNTSSDTVTISTKSRNRLKNQTQKVYQKYVALTPTQSYIVVNTTYNRFRLFKNKKLTREGFCSTGSYTLLKSQDKRQWIFRTPKGLYRILGKVTNPVWRRPDWSFVEEGLPIPSQNDPVRWEPGVLGDYALSIGDGYLIHGTIYKRFLGMPVTHGCIRMNDDDLEAVFKTLDIGSKVYIY